MSIGERQRFNEILVVKFLSRSLIPQKANHLFHTGISVKLQVYYKLKHNISMVSRLFPTIYTRRCFHPDVCFGTRWSVKKRVYGGIIASPSVTGFRGLGWVELDCLQVIQMFTTHPTGWDDINLLSHFIYLFCSDVALVVLLTLSSV